MVLPNQSVDDLDNPEFSLVNEQQIADSETLLSRTKALIKETKRLARGGINVDDQLAALEKTEQRLTSFLREFKR